MNILTIIPARMGSRRVPGKNLSDIAGHPMFVWAVKAAHEAGLYDVVVSSDSPATLAIAQGWCQVRRRPAHLCGDDVPMMAVVRDIATCADEEKRRYDAILLLQPTSPLRTGADITAALDVMVHTGAEAVISVTDAPSDLVFEVGHAGRLRNVHARDPLVVPNGAIFLMRSELVFTHTWWDCVSYAYPMPKERSLDIDTAADLEQAREMMRKREAANVG